MGRLLRHLGSALLVLCLASGLARAAPEVGWWWNPAEDGRGYFIESQNGYLFFGACLYDSDGRATWVVAGGESADPYHYRGRLLAFRDGQTMFGDYQPPAEPADLGEVTLHFSDDGHATLDWPGGVVAIERMRFGAGSANFAPDNGWWWAPEESGRGFAIERQGDTLFVVGFMYDESGAPVWYFSAGSMETRSTYAGTWQQFSGGQTMDGPYHPPAQPVTVAAVDIEFLADDSATMTFTDAASTAQPAGAKAGPKPKVINLRRQFPAKPRELPQKWKGSMSSNYVAFIETKTATTKTEISYVVKDAVWQVDYGVAPPYRPQEPPGVYERYYPVSGTVEVTFKDELVDLATGSICETKPTTIKFPLTSAVEIPNFLDVSDRGRYLGGFNNTYSWTATRICTFRLPDGGTQTETFVVEWGEIPFDLVRFEGVVSRSPMAVAGDAEWLMFPSLPGTRTRTAQWYLEATP